MATIHYAHFVKTFQLLTASSVLTISRFWNGSGNSSAIVLFFIFLSRTEFHFFLKHVDIVYILFFITPIYAFLLIWVLIPLNSKHILRTNVYTWYPFLLIILLRFLHPFCISFLIYIIFNLSYTGSPFCFYLTVFSFLFSASGSYLFDLIVYRFPDFIYPPEHQWTFWNSSIQDFFMQLLLIFYNFFISSTSLGLASSIYLTSLFIKILYQSVFIYSEQSCLFVSF